MLIIFDLDDTLVDTSGSITPRRLEKAFYRMVEKGLPVDDAPSALKHLQLLNSTAPSARAALLEFLAPFAESSSFLETGLKEVYESLSFDFPVYPTPDAPAVLQRLGLKHQLALVSIGQFPLQMEKMKKAGIDSTIFSKIVVCEGNKKNYYKAIVQEVGITAKEVFVCGDKVEIDLLPAKELGYTTVHMRLGRGLNNRAHYQADYIINELKELENFI